MFHQSKTASGPSSISLDALKMKTNEELLVRPNTHRQVPSGSSTNWVPYVENVFAGIAEQQQKERDDGLQFPAQDAEHRPRLHAAGGESVRRVFKGRKTKQKPNSDGTEIRFFFPRF